MPSNDELPDVEFDIPSCVEHGEFDLSCSDCVALLPELTATEKASMSSLGEDFIPRLFLATAIAEDLVEKDLIPEDATSNVASAICSYLNKRVLVKSTLATEQAGEQAIDEAWLREIGFVEGRDSWAVWRLASGELSIEMDRWPPTDEWRVFAVRGGLSVLLRTPIAMKDDLIALLIALGIEVKHAS